jgi:uncharacterized protein with von Willebrand factor type A (vWA) domain
MTEEQLVQAKQMAEEQLVKDVGMLLENDRQFFNEGSYMVSTVTDIQEVQEKTILELQRSNRILQRKLKDVREEMCSKLRRLQTDQHRNREDIRATINRYVKTCNKPSTT